MPVGFSRVARHFDFRGGFKEAVLAADVDYGSDDLALHQAPGPVVISDGKSGQEPGSSRKR
jgi:hypothetical protein